MCSYSLPKARILRNNLQTMKRFYILCAGVLVAGTASAENLEAIDFGRAFNFVIDEVTGRMTVAVTLDGLSVTVFGACTDADT